MIRAYLAATPGVGPSDTSDVRLALKDLVHRIGAECSFFDIDPIPISELLCSTNGLDVKAYLTESFYSLCDRVARESLTFSAEDRYVSLTLTGLPIYSEGQYLFGATDYRDFADNVTMQRQFSLLSTEWLSSVEGARRTRLLRRLTQHEFGHALGLVPEGRQETVELYGTHCARVCVMRQGTSVAQFEALAEEEDASAALFCDLCRPLIRC